MDVLTSEICWALNKVIIKQVASSLSLFTQLKIFSKTYKDTSIKSNRLLLRGKSSGSLFTHQYETQILGMHKSQATKFVLWRLICVATIFVTYSVAPFWRLEFSDGSWISRKCEYPWRKYSVWGKFLNIAEGGKYSQHSTSTGLTNYKVKVKVKQSHYRPGQAQRVLRKLRFPDFVTTAQDCGTSSALRTGRLYPQEILLVLIGRILCQWKIHWHQLGSNQRPSDL